MAKGRAAVKVSARPPPRFSEDGDFVVWVQRFELYLEEAEVPPAKRVRELVSLLDDRPFRYVSQLGLLTSDSYETVRSELRKQYSPVADETEWQFHLQSRRQKSGETLAEFAGELRMLADRAYPDWKVEQRMEMVKNQFVQGVHFSSMHPACTNEGEAEVVGTALELAQTHEVVETAQKRLHASQMVATLSKFNEDSVAGETSGTTNALQTNEPTLQELSRQVKQLSDTIARLTMRGPSNGRLRRSMQRQRRRGPVCWGCREQGHMQRNFPNRAENETESRKEWSRCQPSMYKLNSLAAGSSLMVDGYIGKRPTQMLVDTGSAVTINVWREAAGDGDQLSLEATARSVVAANGEQLRLLGQTEVRLHVGGLQVFYNVLVAKGLTQECLLGADFLSKHGCIVDLRRQVLCAGEQSVNLHSDSIPQVCLVTLAETAVIPGRHQMCVPVHLSPQGSGKKLPLQECLGILEPMEQFCEWRGLLVARFLAFSSSTVACILNPSLAPIKMHANERIGQFKPLGSQVPLPATAQVSAVVPTHQNTALRQMEHGIQGLTEKEKSKLHHLLEEYAAIISPSEEDMGRTNVVRHTINTGDADPVRQPPHWLPFHQRSIVKQMLDIMLSKGVIEPAAGPWSSPIVLVPKKKGQFAFVSISDV